MRADLAGFSRGNAFSRASCELAAERRKEKEVGSERSARGSLLGGLKASLLSPRLMEDELEREEWEYREFVLAALRTSAEELQRWELLCASP